MYPEFMLHLQCGEDYVQEVQCLAVSLEREVYTPYASMTATFLSEGEDYGNVTGISLYHRGNHVYQGIADSVRQYRRDNRVFVQVTSRSYTSVLAQNEIPGGLHTEMTMQKLMTGFYQFPKIYYEDYAGTGYIYVREGTSLWDSIVHFCYKLTGNYPYIYMNTVRLTQADTQKEIVLEEGQVLEYGTMQDTTKLVSRYHMEDINGTQGVYQLENPAAAEAEIVRNKQIALDMQYLYEPEKALEFRCQFSRRGSRAKYVEYSGFSREQLCDRVTFGDFLQNAVICRIRMTFGTSGITTRLWAYDDGFYHIADNRQQ